MPPFGASGCGAILVQITKPSGAGSPEATPSEKGFAEKTGLDQAPALNSPPAEKTPAEALKPLSSARRFTVANASTLKRCGKRFGMTISLEPCQGACVT